MATGIKAVVFKTGKLQATKDFFEKRIGLRITEASAQHFVLQSQGVRIVFLGFSGGFETGFYIHEEATRLPKATEPGTASADIETCKDPNGISIVTVG